MKPITVKTSGKPPPEPRPQMTVEEWGDHVFRNASHFTVYRHAYMARGERRYFSDFAQAAINAYPDPRALVYAVTRTGRSVCLVRDRWEHYLAIWKEIWKSKLHEDNWQEFGEVANQVVQKLEGGK